MSDCDVSKMEEIMAQPYDPERDTRLSRVWSVSFKTKDKKYHPIRLNYDNPMAIVKAMQDAAEYLNENANWLSMIDDIYRTRA